MRRWAVELNKLNTAVSEELRDLACLRQNEDKLIFEFRDHFNALKFALKAGGEIMPMPAPTPELSS